MVAMGKGPAEFIETFLSFRGQPFRLFPFQREFANQTDLLHDKIALRKGRQVGGSLLVAALVVYYVSCYPYATVIIVSKTKDQASLISTYCRDFFANSPMLSALIDRDKTKIHELYLTNNSKVITRSAGMLRADTIRGHSVQGFGFLVFDESAFIPADAIRNTYYAASGDCGIVHVSTPYRPVGAFYDACKNPRFRQYVIPCSVSPRITRDDLAFWKADMPASKYANEVLAEFAQGESCCFDPADIERAIDNALPIFPGPFVGNANKNYHYSLDVAGVGNDKWALTIGSIDKGILSVVAHHAWRGTIWKDKAGEETDYTDNPDEVIHEIMRYHKERNYHCTKLYVDSTANPYFADTLESKYVLPVERVVWSTQNKERLISHCQTVFRSNRIRIPKSDAIIREILAYSYDTKRMQDSETKILYLGGGDDDWVSSIAQLSNSVHIQSQLLSYVESW